MLPDWANYELRLAQIFISPKASFISPQHKFISSNRIFLTALPPFPLPIVVFCPFAFYLASNNYHPLLPLLKSPSKTRIKHCISIQSIPPQQTWLACSLPYISMQQSQIPGSGANRPPLSPHHSLSPLPPQISLLSFAHKCTSIPSVIDPQLQILIRHGRHIPRK